MDRLSRRELQILARLAEGDSDKQMARRFGISVQTADVTTQVKTGSAGVIG